MDYIILSLLCSWLAKLGRRVFGCMFLGMGGVYSCV